MKTHFKKMLLFLTLIAGHSALTMDHPKASIPWELLNGTKRGNEKTLLASKLSPDDQLIEAVSKNSTDQVASLLAHGADANATSKDEESALILAIENENESICELLIAAGAELGIANPHPDFDPYWPPLTTAARIGNEHICKLLIDAGADINEAPYIRYHNGYSAAVWHAVYNGHIGTVRLLLDHGADKPKAIKLPLLPSIEMHKNFEAMQELLNQYDIALEMRTPKEQHITEDCDLLTHIIKGHFGATKKTLQLGIDVNCVFWDFPTSTPLHRAADRPHYEVKRILKHLLKLGANPNARDRFGKTPLMHASGSEGHVYKKNCEILLAHGALPNLIDPEGRTALHYAARRYDSETCQLLLKNGALINAQDREGNTPLMVLVEKSNNKEKVQTLLAAHPNMLIKNNLGNTALLHAALHQPLLCPMLIEYQITQEKKVITLLCHLKYNEHAKARELYGLSKHLLRPYLEQYTVKALLRSKNNRGK
jgi:ankyrin repeat domain-containing protein 50